MFRCKDLMTLPSFAGAKLVSGQAGISNTIRWVYKPEDMNFSKWIRGHELLIISTPVIKNAEFDLMKLLVKAVELHMAGLLLLVGDNYIENIPDDIISYSNKNRCPIFAISGTTPLIDIFEEIGHAIAYDDQNSSQDNGLLSAIVFGNDYDAKDYVESCTESGFDADGAKRVFILRLKSLRMMNTYDYENVSEIIKHEFMEKQIPVLVARFGNSYIGCFGDKPDRTGFAGLIDDVYRSISSAVSKQYTGWMTGMGIGCAYTDITKLHRSYNEASRCIYILDRLRDGLGISRYEDMGLYNIFMECSDRQMISDYVENTLGELIRYDEENDADMVLTLKSYLWNSCSILHTSEELHTHRNTVKYRIGRIQEITGRSLDDAGVRLEFMNALLCMSLSFSDSEKR